MSGQPTDARLAELYASLLQRRRGSGAEPAVSVETVHALASGDYPGADRITLLDRVLRDASLTAEFELFRELAAVNTARPRRFRPPVLALAAGIGVVSLAGLVWLLTHRRPLPELLRGDSGAPALIAPAGGSSLAPGERLLWHAVPDAVEYRVELADREGTIRFAQTLRDSLTSLPDSVRLLPGTKYLWWVTATLSDGTSRRASPLTVNGRAP